MSLGLDAEIFKMPFLLPGSLQLPLGCQDLCIWSRSKWRWVWSRVLTCVPWTPPAVFLKVWFWNLHQNNLGPGPEHRLLSPAPDQLVEPGHLCFGQVPNDSDARYGNHWLGRSMHGLRRIHALLDTENNILFLHMFI